MAHKKVHPVNDFSQQRDILTFKPKIDFVEPETIPDIPPPELVDEPLSLEETLSDLNQSIEDYGNLVVTADEAQNRIDQRVGNLEIYLDPTQDAHIIDATRRHFGDPDKTTITFKEYKECIEDINIHSVRKAFGTENSDLTDALNEPSRTTFGSLGKLPGLGRPELEKNMQTIEPLDLSAFKVEQLLQLVKLILELMLSGPIGKVLKFPLRAILRFINKKLEKYKKKKRKYKSDKVNSLAKDEDIDVDSTYPTQMQDCTVIAGAYERGAHFTNTESAAIAPLTRTVQNSKAFSLSMQRVLYGYKAKQSLNKDTDDVDAQGNQIIHDPKLALKFGTADLDLPAGRFNDRLERAVKECIPCEFRLTTTMFIKLHEDFNNSIKKDILSRIDAFGKLKDLLDNVDLYGDFCDMVGFLNFMCIPDLQRILVVLAAKLTDVSINLGGVMGLLLQIVAPFIMPILMSLNGLFDRLIQLVLDPIDCIIKSINLHTRKLILPEHSPGKADFNTTEPNVTKTYNNSITNGSTGALRELKGNIVRGQNQTRSALIELGTSLQGAEELIRRKLAFYQKQFDSLLKKAHLGDASYMSGVQDKLAIIRLIGLIQAMIKAKSLGDLVCQNQLKPSESEIQRFYEHYVSPNSPFNITVNKNGDLQITEKEIQEVIISQPTLNTSLIKFSPVSRVFKCEIATSIEDADKVNTWIAELSRG